MREEGRGMVMKEVREGKGKGEEGRKGEKRKEGKEGRK